MLVMPGVAVSGDDPLAPAGRWEGRERGAASTPPMGWNSWNAFRTEVDEDKVMGAARVLVDSGLAKLGYRYVNIDDGWWLKRRQSDGRVQIRTSIFPSAATGGKDGTSFRPFTDKLHAMGLKAGIYTDIGRNACSQAYDLHSPNLPQG
ncbi:MAG TPA: Sip1-related alpha-galactosidase, partial [Duganella sp.]|nr:Sip1-related alpha-galactosidase [Duganella sp.]